MGQVSGSISLDMTKVTRESALAVAAELTRGRVKEDEPAPLEIIVDKITERVAQLTSADLLRIERKIDALTQLVRAEAGRRDRLTGEIPVVRDTYSAGQDLNPAPSHNAVQHSG